MKVFPVLLVSLVVAMISLNNNFGVEAQVHHFVGGDFGWTPSTDININSWSSYRNFKVGDSIWFTYLANEDSISELKSREEYESCDVSNPIRMLTDGVDKVSLDGEGTRYFVSSQSDNCKKGLKLHVEVLPTTTTTTMVEATGHLPQFLAPPPPNQFDWSPPPPPPVNPFDRAPPPPPPPSPFSRTPPTPPPVNPFDKAPPPPPPPSPFSRTPPPPPPVTPFARPPPPPSPATPYASPPPPPAPATPSASPPTGLQIVSSSIMMMMMSFGLVRMLLFS